MENETNVIEPFFTAAFGKDVAKSLIISATTSVGMFVGLVAVGAALTWWDERKKTVFESAYNPN